MDDYITDASDDDGLEVPPGGPFGTPMEENAMWVAHRRMEEAAFFGRHYARQAARRPE